VAIRAAPGAPDSRRLAEARKRIDAALRDAAADPPSRARALALAADASLLAGDRMSARSYAARAAAAYPGDELAALAEARLEPSAAKRAILLEKAASKADGGARLEAELGATLVELGRYREALAALDPALAELPEAYAALYGPAREKAFALRDAGAPQAVKGSTQALKGGAQAGEGGGAAEKGRGEALARLGPGQTSLGAMVELALEETSALDWLTGGSPGAPGPFFERLKGSGWFLEPNASRSTAATRKDAALFLWQLMSRGDSRKLHLYTERYAGRESPVPDVPYDSAFFDAVLGVVEEDVMQLPDGRRFLPDEALGGLEYYSMLEAAASRR
jgi:tetratricopeptide (TPR) repeat protein